jgi:hypothetical protein
VSAPDLIRRLHALGCPVIARQVAEAPLHRRPGATVGGRGRRHWSGRGPAPGTPHAPAPTIEQTQWFERHAAFVSVALVGDLLSHPLRRARLARDVLHDRHGVLADERDRRRLGSDAVARDAAWSFGWTPALRF